MRETGVLLLCISLTPKYTATSCSCTCSAHTHLFGAPMVYLLSRVQVAVSLLEQTSTRTNSICSVAGAVIVKTVFYHLLFLRFLSTPPLPTPPLPCLCFSFVFCIRC